MTEQAESPEAAAPPLYPLWLRAWHGLHALCFVLLAASGLSLHYSESYDAALPFGLAVRVHDATGIAMTVLYVWFVVRNATSGNLRHYSLPRPALRSIGRQLVWYVSGMFQGAPRPFPRSRDAKLNPAQASTYLLVMYAITPACVLSGVALLFPQLAPERVAGVGGVWPMALLHLASGWLLSLFLLLHLYMVTTGPRLWTYLVEIARGEDAAEMPTGTADASSGDSPPEESVMRNETSRRGRERGGSAPWLALLLGAALVAPSGARADDGEAAAAPAPPPRPRALADREGFVLTSSAGGVPLGLWVSGQARARGEAVGPRDLSGGDPAMFVDHRMRLRTGMAAGDHLAVRFDIQDVRRWGEEVPLPGKPGDPTAFAFSGPGIDFHQGYVDLAAGEALLRVGRQEISLDDQRLLGALDWLMQGRTFDGGRLNLGPKDHKLSTFAFIVRDADTTTDPDNPIPDQAITGAHYKWVAGPWLQVAPLLLLDGKGGPGGLLRWTTGARVNGSAAGFGYDAAAYYQGANVEAGITVAALLAAKASYAADVLLHPSVKLFGDLLSGDTDPTSTGGLSPFDTLYATNHKFYGFQDLFLNVPLHTGGRGLVDTGAGLGFSEGWLFGGLDLHLFAAADFADDPLYGVEPDLTLGFKPLAGVKVQGGASTFVPLGGGLGRGNQVTPWVYLMLVTQV